MRGGSCINYSLNKRKRWLLAEELRQNICSVNNLEDLDFKTVLVERELTTFSSRSNCRPDCVRICESHSERPEVLPNEKYALASQLRLKSKGLIAVPRKKWWDPHPDNALSEDDDREEEPDVELHYEICCPRPQEKWEWRQDTPTAPWEKKGD